jgi:hypothetical protein
MFKVDSWSLTNEPEIVDYFEHLQRVRIHELNVIIPAVHCHLKEDTVNTDVFPQFSYLEESCDGHP